MLAVIIEEESLRAPFPFIVTGPGADGIDAPQVGLRLGMNSRIPINLGSGGLKNLGLESFGKAQHIDGTMDVDFGGLDWIILVVDRSGRAGKVVNLVSLHIKGKGDVVAYQLKKWVLKEMQNIPFCSRVEVIHA